MMLEATNIKRKTNGVPILKVREMDELGEEIVRCYSPEILKTPKPFNIEEFIELEMGLSLDFVYLSNCQCYLGMMVFNDTSVATWVPETNDIEYQKVNAGTILVDSSLLIDNQEARLRFTLGHESVGHAFLHRPYYQKDQNQISMFDELVSMKPCKWIEHFDVSLNKTDSDWMEWQADCMSAAVLMPKTAVQRFVTQGREEYGFAQSYQEINSFYYFLTDKMMKTFHVSRQSAQIRLKHLLNENQPFV